MTNTQARAYFAELGHRLMPTDRVCFDDAESCWGLWRNGSVGSERIAKFTVYTPRQAKVIEDAVTSRRPLSTPPLPQSRESGSGQ